MEEILKWNSNYELGIQEFDRRHHFFITLINRLVQAIKQTEDPVYQASLLNELYSYAKFHFVSEENLMLRVDYPLLVQHQQQHHELLEELGKLEQNLHHCIDSIKLNLSIDQIINWFLQHTDNDDKRLTKYLTNQIN